MQLKYWKMISRVMIKVKLKPKKKFNFPNENLMQ